MVTVNPIPKPIRDVHIEYEIDDEKCLNCKDKPCLNVCPIDSVYVDSDTKFIKLDENCFGCVLCSNACPYDAIHIKKTLSDPIRENVPNINKKLCRACGACVNACKSGAIHLKSTGGEEMHSEIDEDKCIRCGYCFRACPTDAIKYGQILPKTVKEGKTLCIDQDQCIGCMTCTRICPSKGAINVGKTNKLPFIDPAYCARCEECMNACPTYAIDYVEREEAFESFNKIKTLEIASEILDRDVHRISKEVTNIDKVLIQLLSDISKDYHFDDFDYENSMDIRDVPRGMEFSKVEIFTCTHCRSIVVDVTEFLNERLTALLKKDLEVEKVLDIVEFFPPALGIEVIEDNCISCGLCADVCPTESIALDGPNPIKIDTDNSCVYCGFCAEVCNFEAIKLSEEFFTNRNHEIFFIKRDLRGRRNGTVEINHPACQLCEVCVKNCPVEALAIEDDKVTVNHDECISCRNCEAICPLNAIKVSTIWQFL